MFTVTQNAGLPEPGFLGGAGAGFFVHSGYGTGTLELRPL